MWNNHNLEKNYDVVIIGGGAHGLATAYYLTKLGITNIAVLEQKYIGYGGSGRNTAILRSNYRTEEGIKFYDHSLSLYEVLAGELDFNLMFSQQGHFTLGHSTAAISGLVTRAENNKALGINSYFLDPKEIKKRIAPNIIIGFFHFDERKAAIGTMIIIARTTKLGTPTRNLRAPQDHSQTSAIMTKTIQRRIRTLADLYNWSDPISMALLK